MLSLSGSASEILVCVDFNSIESWLALAPTLKLVQKYGAMIDWVPLTAGMKRLSNENHLPDKDKGFEDYKRRRYAARQAYTQLNQQRYAALLNLSEEDLSRQHDTRLAAIGLLWLKHQCREKSVSYIQSVFEVHFRLHGDIEDESVIDQLLGQAGAETGGFGSFVEGEGKRELESVQDWLADAGLFSAPAYLYLGERYHGREHLPLIAWYLGHKEGEPPV